MTDDSRLRQQLSLYLVTDDEPHTHRLLTTIARALDGGVTTVQLRRKHDDGRRLVEIGLAIRDLTRRARALYIVNDRVDIALLTDADGVHVGQSDISCTDARKLLPQRIVGVSTCTLEEALQAQQDGANYLGVGAIFPTTSKADADMCGIGGLARIAQRINLPIVGIGGISHDNAKQVFDAGADGIAVVSAIMQAPDAFHASAAFRNGIM